MKLNNSLFYPLNIVMILFVMAIPFTACDDDNDIDDTRTFTVTIQNVSTAATLQPGALPDRTAPLSPGAWAVYDDGSIFNLNQEANLAVERLAEEGMPDLITADLNAATWVEDNGEFSAPAGANGPVIGSGESVTFTFDANPGDQLQIMTMFGNSNDWFYAFGNGGLDLFDNDNDPVSGDVTAELELYDAGTELDEMPGLGVTQKPDHPTTINIGPVDPVDQIQIAAIRHSAFIIPATNSVIRVTVASSL